MWISKLILALALLCATIPSWAAEKASPPACSSGVCAINIFADDLMTTPCSGYSGLISYSQSSGATLIQCSAPVRETKIFIFDRHNSKASSYQIVDGHSLRPEYLIEQMTGSAPDVEVSIPVCNITKQRKTAGLLVGEKEPSGFEATPYCYRIYYIDASATALAVTRDDGYKVPPAPKKTVAKWSTLRRKLTALIKP